MGSRDEARYGVKLKQFATIVYRLYTAQSDQNLKILHDSPLILDHFVSRWEA